MAKVVYLLLVLLLVNLMLTATVNSQWRGRRMHSSRRRGVGRLHRDRRDPTATEKVVDENWEASESNIDPAKKQ